MPDKNEPDLNKMVREALNSTSNADEYSLGTFAEITQTPWPTTRWHLELLEASDVMELLASEGANP